MQNDYATEAAIVGVPQELIKLVVSGGKYVTKVVGAVAAPILVAGLVTPVPPEMLSLEPAPDPPGSTQVVLKVSTVGDALLFTEAFI
jgi:hypothetical protein